MDPYRHLSILAIIISAAMVFAAEQAGGTSFAESHGVVSPQVRSACNALVNGELNREAARALSRMVTALFLHGDIEHILLNMVFLWAFGYLTSEILGQWWALVVFLVCGICGNALQVGLSSDSIPIIGASGAICGFEGVYLGLALRWQLPWPDVWPLARPVPPLQLGAFAVIGFIADLYLLANHEQGIAYGAHIGGFLSGLAIALVVTTIYPTASAYRQAERR
jgi:membrane associated rhomboid family serine protease